MKSLLVHKAKEEIMELYEISKEGTPSGINLRIDFLLDKNRYFCKYQSVGHLTQYKVGGSWILIIVIGDTRRIFLCPTTHAVDVGDIWRKSQTG